jgi:hypothetical protein
MTMAMKEALAELPDELPSLVRTDTWAVDESLSGPADWSNPNKATLAGQLCGIAGDVLLGIRIRDECQQVLATGKKQRSSSQTAKDVLWPLLVVHDRKYESSEACPPRGMTDLCMYYALVMHAKYHATADQLDSLVAFGRRVFFYDDNKSVLRYLRAMKEILSDINTPGQWRKRLTMGAELMAECNRQSSERVDLKMRAPIDIDSRLIERISTTCVLDSQSVCRRRSSLFICKWIGVQLAIGCRMCEVVLPSVTFECVSELERERPQSYIKQIGRAKDPQGLYANAALIKEIVGGLTCGDLLSAIASIRAEVQTSFDGQPHSKLPEIVNRKFNATAVCIVKRLFPSQAEHCLRLRLGFGTHFLRAAWVNYLWERHRSDSDCPTQTRFIAEHLGHDMSFMSAKNYECVRVRRSTSGSRSSNAAIAIQEPNGGAGEASVGTRWAVDVPVSASEPEKEIKRRRVD